MITAIALTIFWILVVCLSIVGGLALFIGLLVMFNWPK